MELNISNIEGNNFATASNVYDVYQESNDKDDFEAVLDNLILEKYSDDEETKNYIKNLPKENKRIATVSLLSNDNILWTKINDLLKSDLSSYERLKGVYTCLKDYIKIADVDRKGRGEVHTPFKELAEPMVKLVEKYDVDFWKNKNHKVLDSSAGYGTFLILAAYKFMVGLKDDFPDEEERFKWIVENCLYYGEIQSKSVFSWLVAIDPFDKYKTNIYWGDFLSEDFDKHMKEVWGIEEDWDLIIQNPPFQIRKEGFKKTQPLWHLFVQKSLTLLKEGGYMVMVHPSGWRNIDGIFKETQIKLKENQIFEISIHDEREGNDVFGATTGYDYYILKNINNFKETKIHFNNESGLLNLNKLEFIPGGYFDLYDKVLAKENDDKCLIYYSRSAYGTDKIHMSREKTDTNIHECVYTVQKDETINLFYSNTNRNGHFGIPKVIWSNGKASTPIVDKEGKYGLTQFSYAIIDEVENLNNIKKAMCSDKFQTFIKSFDMNSGDRFNRKVIATFKKDFWREFI